LGARRDQLRAEGAVLEVRRLGLLDSCAAGERRRTELDAALAAAAASQTAREAGLAGAQARVEQQEAGLHARRAQLDTRRELYNQGEIARARLEADAAHLRQTCRDELGCELEALLLAAAADALVAASVAAAEAPGEATPPADDAAGLEARVRELRQRIENLGPVNMMALEEYEEASQRHGFMQAQRQDLIAAIADTQTAIQEMDAISRQKFQEAFERINEYFQETFRVLFGGGQGFLRLSEIEGSADGGVDLVAQPPGKKLQNALLLSGGEKAMTAMALLLAIFRFQPSPFCLLDEVDAPMDEANVARFSHMVEQMGANTQFILITHNRRTMESAPTLYGVTMPHPGVSRLVSVMVEEAQQAAS
ncbi:MAG: chromosome segregation protein SMC, partial [Terriglobales bacterium]